MKQGDQEVTEYYTEMLGFWQDLDLNYEEEWECTGDSVRFKKKMENERVFDFIVGLNRGLHDFRSKDLLSGKTIGNAKECDGLYYFNETDVCGQCSPTVYNSASRHKDSELFLWHKRMGHPSF
ncbi:hypothetical protein CK203_031548 [Vitis vinifera]|uniref:GAG-pre-integrase domain-containing protein n=1 Tax=Vitis vinifera TaxID=29760 RepID=A0A438IG78_VITVI|nr:hypothetical protein CK203_031548 [Vitis vinifera]